MKPQDRMHLMGASISLLMLSIQFVLTRAEASPRMRNLRKTCLILLALCSFFTVPALSEAWPNGPSCYPEFIPGACAWGQAAIVIPIVCFVFLFFFIEFVRLACGAVARDVATPLLSLTLVGLVIAVDLTVGTSMFAHGGTTTTDIVATGWPCLILIVASTFYVFPEDVLQWVMYTVTGKPNSNVDIALLGRSPRIFVATTLLGALLMPLYVAAMIVFAVDDLGGETFLSRNTMTAILLAMNMFVTVKCCGLLGLCGGHSNGIGTSALLLEDQLTGTGGNLAYVARVKDSFHTLAVIFTVLAGVAILLSEVWKSLEGWLVLIIALVSLVRGVLFHQAGCQDEIVRSVVVDTSTASVASHGPTGALGTCCSSSMHGLPCKRSQHVFRYVRSWAGRHVWVCIQDAASAVFFFLAYLGLFGKHEKHEILVAELAFLNVLGAIVSGYTLLACWVTSLKIFPTDDSNRLTTIVKTTMLALKGVILSQSVGSGSWNVFEIVTLVLFACSVLAVIAITYANSSVMMKPGFVQDRIDARFPKCVGVCYVVLFAMVKLLFIVIVTAPKVNWYCGIYNNRHFCLDSKVVSVLSGLGAGVLFLTVVVTNEIARHLDYVDVTVCCKRGSVVTLEGARAVIPVSVIALVLFAVAVSIIPSLQDGNVYEFPAMYAFWAVTAVAVISLLVLRIGLLLPSRQQRSSVARLQSTATMPHGL